MSLQTVTLDGLALTEILRHVSRGHCRVLTLWWTRLNCRRTTQIRRSYLMTVTYVPLKAVKAPEMSYFATSVMSALRQRLPRLDDSRSALSPTAWWNQRISQAGLLEGRQIICSGRNARKRNMIANAITVMMYARNGCTEEFEDRREIACAVCVRKE